MRHNKACQDLQDLADLQDLQLFGQNYWSRLSIKLSFYQIAKESLLLRVMNYESQSLPQQGLNPQSSYQSWSQQVSVKSQSNLSQV